MIIGNQTKESKKLLIIKGVIFMSKNYIYQMLLACRGKRSMIENEDMGSGVVEVKEGIIDK